MKTVFSSHSQLAHVWAQQTQPTGRAGNMLFDGDTIFSWGRHWAIARFTDKVDGPDRVVLFSDNTRSTSTGQHHAIVRNALYGLPVTVIPVNDPLADSTHQHKANLVQMRVRFNNALEKASRARVYRNSALEVARTIAANAERYARIFGLPAPDWPPVQESTLADVRERDRKEIAAHAKLTRERNIRKEEEYRRRVAEWRKGWPVQIPYRSDAPTLLRLKPGNERIIQTSRGAEVPRKVAAGVWQLAKLHHDSATPYEGFGRDVGGFWLSGVSEAGDVKIGCHTLKYAELERFAKVLGLIKAEEIAA